MRLISSLFAFLSRNSYLLPLAVVSLTLAMLLLTLLPSDIMGNSKLWSYDKLGHTILFGSWCLFVGLYYQISKSIAVKLWVIFISGISFGLLIEILQHILPVNRSADPIDFLFDALGCLLAVWVLKVIHPYISETSLHSSP